MNDIESYTQNKAIKIFLYYMYSCSGFWCPSLCFSRGLWQSNAVVVWFHYIHKWHHILWQYTHIHLRQKLSACGCHIETMSREWPVEW